MTAPDRPIGEDLRAIRQGLGWSLAQVEVKSGGRWILPVVGSWERGHRHPTVDKVRELLAWYGGHRLALLYPGDRVFRAAGEDGDPIIRYVFVLNRPDGKCVDCSSREEAASFAASIPGARVGYRLLGPVKFEAES